MKSASLARQKGMSFWGFIWSAVIVVCISYLLVISIPHYINNQKLYRALEDLAVEPGIMNMNRHSMIRLLNRKLNIDYADNIVNLNTAFKVRNVDAKKELSINYELVVPVFYNVSLLFDFENSVLTRHK